MGFFKILGNIKHVGCCPTMFSGPPGLLVSCANRTRSDANCSSWDRHVGCCDTRVVYYQSETTKWKCVQSNYCNMSKMTRIPLRFKCAIELLPIYAYKESTWLKKCRDKKNISMFEIACQQFLIVSGSVQDIPSGNSTQLLKMSHWNTVYVIYL